MPVPVIPRTGSVPVKRHPPGSRAEDTKGQKGAHGHTDHTDEPHNHPNPPTHPHDSATTESARTAADSYL
jgi:hypothetical protein